MHISIDLQDMFSYSLTPIIILVITLILFILIVLILNHKPKNIQKIKIVRPTNLNDIKNKYLLRIDHLSLEVNQKNISTRHAYQKLSQIIRMFIYEVTGIKVQNYTLNDIKMINIPILSILVEEYYHPEFSEEAKGDIISSIGKTREVITRWN